MVLLSMEEDTGLLLSCYWYLGNQYTIAVPLRVSLQTELVLQMVKMIGE